MPRASDIASGCGWHGDVIDFVGKKENLEFREASARVAGMIGMGSAPVVATGAAPTPTPAKKGKPVWTPICPVPVDAPAPMPKHHAYGKPSTTWKYLDAAGKLLGYVCRFELEGGGKEVWPQCYAHDEGGRREWRWVSFPKPRLLYGLDLLAANPAANVVVIEGEKAADAARALPSSHGGVLARRREGRQTYQLDAARRPARW